MDCAAPASFAHTRDIRSMRPPLPPSGGIGGGPKERWSLAFSHRATPSASQMELAEGVKFLEKYAHLDHLESPVGGGGRWSKWNLPCTQGSSGGGEGGLAKRI